MHTLENNILSISFDVKGMIISLIGQDKYEFVQSPGLWRIIYQRHMDQEIEMLAADVDCTSVNITGNRAELIHESELVRVRMTAMLEGCTVRFSAAIDCKADILIREFQFPYFNMGSLNDFSLIRSSFGGARFNDLREAFACFHTNYMGTDNKAVTMNELYPGEAATNCFCLFTPGHGLYFGSHDSTFQITLHHLRCSEDGIRASLVKYPFIGAGGKAQFDGFTLAPFNGDWHEAAGIYRAWADTWFKAPEPPQWVCDFNGWQRLIMRHQYGQTFFGYKDLPKMLADGMASGLDSLLLFGWWAEGMDAGYPNYVADEAQGGFSALRKGINAVRQEGGRTLLYFNGQLIDHSSEFYRESGRRISVKLERGDDHTETYSFGGEGTSLRQFGNRVFSTACFSSEEWVEVLRTCVDKTIELGCDGIFFDQFGMKLWPCFDASHGHPVPDMCGFATKAKIVEELHAYAESRKPGIAFGTEMVSDRLAPHVDFFHTVNCGYGRNWRGGDAFLEWFRFMFPEIIVSDREIRDENGDFKLRANHALQMGLKSDAEIFRCRATIAEAPKYADYMKDINRLRDEFREFIFKGRFLDDVPLHISNPEIRAKAFAAGKRLLIIVTHRKDETLSGQIAVPGYRYEKISGLGKFSLEVENNQCELVIEACAIAGLEFTRL